MNTSAISFTSSYSTISWFFASFDANFNLVDSIYCPPANSPNAPPPLLGIGSEYIVSDPMNVITGGYIQAIYFDQQKYCATNTLYISDVNGIQERPLSALIGSNAQANQKNLQKMAVTNKNTGLLDISTLPNENVSFVLCGDVTPFVANDTTILSLPHGCSNGFIFGNNDSAPSICVAPDVITAIANNWVSDYASPYKTAYPTSYSSSTSNTSSTSTGNNTGSNTSNNTGSNTGSKNIGKNIKTKLASLGTSSSDSGSTNYLAIILVIIFILVLVALVVFAVLRYRDDHKMQ